MAGIYIRSLFSSLEDYPNLNCCFLHLVLEYLTAWKERRMGTDCCSMRPLPQQRLYLQKAADGMWFNIKCRRYP